MKKNNNRIVVDLNKCQTGHFWWVNQYGNVIYFQPEYETVRGEHVSPNVIALHHPEYPGESMLDRAKRLGILDVWTAVMQFTLSANHSVTYTGDKATAMRRAWDAKIFGKRKES